MVNALLIGAGIILLCLIAYRLSAKLGVPSLLLFILLGILFGIQVDFNDYEIPEKICSLGLIIIIFYGGFGTNWRMARPVAGKAAGMASLGVVITAGLVALFSWLVLGISGLESLLLGAVISSTDAASVFSILRAKKLNLKDNTASLLELESGSNDPFSYMLTLIFLALILGEGMSGGELGYLIFAQLAYGLIGGILIGLLAVLILKKVDFGANGLDSIFVL
ncbi:MAG: cation:proton antiporter, partial [Clostridia bacterium]|nr:cation:proton antiporter [Clostridia bacterium]